VAGAWFGTSAGPTSRLIGRLAEVEDNLAGRLLSMMSAAGLADIVESGHIVTPLGSLSYYDAVRVRTGSAVRAGPGAVAYAPGSWSKSWTQRSSQK
jgi:hypothetical protein